MRLLKHSFVTKNQIFKPQTFGFRASMLYTGLQGKREISYLLHYTLSFQLPKKSHFFFTSWNPHAIVRLTSAWGSSTSEWNVAANSLWKPAAPQNRSMAWGVKKYKHILVLTFYTPTSTCIFSVLFLIHFLRQWQGEFSQKLRAVQVCNHFLNSHEHFLLDSVVIS